jgi:hypothetical protein
MSSNIFDVNVISDPSSALAPNTPMWNTDLTAFARYDVTLLKPVLLFAESVTLRTFRADMLSMTDADEFQFTIMPMRRVNRFLYLSKDRNYDELEYLGIQESILAPSAEARRVDQTIKRRRERDGAWFEYLLKFAEKYSSSINELSRATAKRLSERREALATKDLDHAVGTGLLSVVGWGTEAAERYSDEWFNQRWLQAWITDQDFFEYGFIRLLEALSDNSTATMFEPGSQMMLSVLSSDSTHNVRNTRAKKKRALESNLTSADMAASVIGRLPGLDELTVAEILDIRRDLGEYLPAFRAAMIDLADEISSSKSPQPPEMASKIDKAWEQKISPVLNGMEIYARQHGYPRQLLNVFAEDKGALAGAVSSVGLAAGSLVAGAITFAPAILAASIPFIKALNAVLRGRDELENNRLYFLYKLKKELRDG